MECHKCHHNSVVRLNDRLLCTNEHCGYVVIIQETESMQIDSGDSLVKKQVKKKTKERKNETR